MTHQEMVETSIKILENVRNHNISKAKKQIEKLTPIQIIKMISIASKAYPSEIEKLKDLAIYW